MSRVVLLAVGAKYVHSALAVWILAESVSHLSRMQHDVNVVEATINQRPSDIAARVAAHAPDVVGVSTYIWNAGMLPELLSLLRKNLPKAVLVLGGPEASNNAEYWLCNGADFVLRGEGEYSFPAFLDMLEENSPPESVPGLCRKHGRDVRLNKQAEPSDEFINPYSNAYFAALDGRIAYIETSRGCPFRCAFCLSGSGSDLRFLPLDTAKQQINRLSESGARTIKFVDRTFNCDTRRAYELFSHIVGLDTACCYHFEVAADLFDRRTLSLLNAAPPGRIQLEAGLQSFFEPALRASSRHTNLEKAEENIRVLVGGGNIHIHLDLIAGLPFETLADFQQSFNRAYALGSHTLQLGFLKLLHGSALRDRESRIVCAKEPPYEILSSPWLSAEDLALLKQTETALQHTYNKGRFLLTLRYALTASGMSPFALYHALGSAAPHRATPLKDYAVQIYNCLSAFPGVDPGRLKEYMILDWLGMVKGADMPPFLATADRRRKSVAQVAEKLMGRKIRRCEAVVLPSGRGVFADSESRDPVTGLYHLRYI